MPRERFAQLSAQALRFLRRRRPADRPFERGAAQQLPAVVAAEHQHMARSVRHRSGIHHHRRLARRPSRRPWPAICHAPAGTPRRRNTTAAPRPSRDGRRSGTWHFRVRCAGPQKPVPPNAPHRDTPRVRSIFRSRRETPESVGAVRHAVNVNLILISQCGRGTETRRQLSRRIDAHRISDGRQRIDRARLPLGSQPPKQ